MTFALSPRHVPSLLSRGALAALMTLAVAACAPMGATPQAATFPEPPAPPQAWNVLVTLQGTVQSMTADAQGVPQTLMVQGQGGASQINVGPEFAPVLARRVAQGDTISATVVAEPPPAVNPLIPPEVVGATPAPTAYRLISLRDARGAILRREEQTGWLAKNFRLRKSGDAFGAGIPARNQAGPVDEKDGVIAHILDHRPVHGIARQSLLRLSAGIRPGGLP